MSDDKLLESALSESLGVEPDTFASTNEEVTEGETENVSDETEVVENEETTENETTDESTDDTEQQEKTKEVDVGDEDVLKYFEGKIKYNKETPALKDLGIESMDDFIAYTQMGLNYNKQKEKATNLEQQLTSYNELVKELYPNIDTTEKLLETMVANEMKYIEEQYKEKYDDEADIQKLLKGDDRYNKLKNLEPIKVDKEKIEQDYTEQVKDLNDRFKQSFESYKDLPYEVREIAVDHNLDLADAYKLINFDEIVNAKVEKAKESLIAEVQENKAKAVPKGSGKKDKKSSKTNQDKMLEEHFKAYFGDNF